MALCNRDKFQLNRISSFDFRGWGGGGGGGYDNMAIWQYGNVKQGSEKVEIGLKWHKMS